MVARKIAELEAVDSSGHDYGKSGIYCLPACRVRKELVKERDVPQSLVSGYTRRTEASQYACGTGGLHRFRAKAPLLFKDL